MADRSISVRLRAEVDQYKSAMGSAAGATDAVGTAAEKAGQKQGEQAAKSRTFGQAVVDSARQNEQAWSTVGSTLLVAGGAITGLGIAAAMVGIDYNSMRQTATAALTSVTGSTEGAAAQMKRLDDYGKNSWLMRDTLIRAQTNMTGFGIETEKVIPYMDALAEATAGTGGNNQDFEELVTIMSKIKGQSKITAQELNEFGARGVDAAGLIGDAMGKTGQEIRDEITAGTLDADVALDALAEGMQMKYAGASDLVRNTFQGAFADVQAAIRDIFANMTSVLVDPEGGGLLVSFLNGLSDALFAFRDLPTPVLATVGALTALGGIGATVTGAAMLMVPQLVRLYDSLGNLGRVGRLAQGGMRVIANNLGRVALVGGTLGVATLAVGALMAALTQEGVARNAEDVAVAIEGLAASGGKLGDIKIDQLMAEVGRLDFGAFEVAKIQADDLNGALDTVLNPTATDNLSAFFGAIMPGVTSYMTDYEDVLDSADAALVHMIENGAVQTVSDHLRTMGLTADELAEQFPGATAALEAHAASAADGAGDLDALSDAEIAAAEATEQLTESLAGTASAFVDPMAAFDSFIAKNEGLGTAMEEASSKGAVAWSEFYDGNSFNMSGYLDELDLQVAAQRDWEGNMVILAGRVSEGVLDHLSRLGVEGAPLVAALADASQPELDRFVAAMDAGGLDAGTEFAVSLIESIPLIRAAMSDMSDEAIAELGAGLRSGDVTIQEALDSLDATLPVDADDTLAKNKVIDLSQFVRDQDPDVDMGADGLRGITDTAELYAHVTGMTPDQNMGADPVRGLGDAKGLSGAIEKRTPDQNMGADGSRGVGDAGNLSNFITGRRPDQNMGANPSRGYGDTGRLTDWIYGRQPNVDVGAWTNRAHNNVVAWNVPGKTIQMQANLASARAAVNNWRPVVMARVKGMLGMAGGGDVSAMSQAARGFASGGAIHGPGTGTSDDVPARSPAGAPWWLSNGEHVWTDREVQASGGHGAMYALRSMASRGELRSLVGMRDGGEVSSWSPAQYAPTTTSPRPTLTRATSASGPTLYITNHYPQAEPTSVTTNRAQQYAAAIGEM